MSETPFEFLEPVQKICRLLPELGERKFQENPLAYLIWLQITSPDGVSTYSRGCPGKVPYTVLSLEDMLALQDPDSDTYKNNKSYWDHYANQGRKVEGIPVNRTVMGDDKWVITLKQTPNAPPEYKYANIFSVIAESGHAEQSN